METTVERRSPSKKRYDKQALVRRTELNRYGDRFWLIHAEELRLKVNDRISFIKEGKGFAFGHYFLCKKYYRYAVSEARRVKHVLPLPG